VLYRVINNIKVKTRNKIDDALFGFSTKNMEEILMIGSYFKSCFCFASQRTGWATQPMYLICPSYNTYVI
jgi:cytochrome c oxidase assembly protein Cox11